MATILDKPTANCCMCGRLLTNPHSVNAGIGPICAAKILHNKPGEGIYLLKEQRIVTEDDLIELAAPIIETNPEFKDLRARLLRHPRYRVIRMRSYLKTLPPDHPTLLKWVIVEDEI